ncbi:MAG: hypothetical protein FWB76_01690 [Oscillospiraceae bacterium]|nr:hypothetical protein [Oscillospiraceae bacterium]
MKKIISVLLAATLAVLLFACGANTAPAAEDEAYITTEISANVQADLESFLLQRLGENIADSPFLLFDLDNNGMPEVFIPQGDLQVYSVYRHNPTHFHFVGQLFAPLAFYRNAEGHSLLRQGETFNRIGFADGALVQAAAVDAQAEQLTPLQPLISLQQIVIINVTTQLAAAAQEQTESATTTSLGLTVDTAAATTAIVTQPQTPTQPPVVTQPTQPPAQQQTTTTTTTRPPANNQSGTTHISWGAHGVLAQPGGRSIPRNQVSWTGETEWIRASWTSQGSIHVGMGQRVGAPVGHSATIIVTAIVDGTPFTMSLRMTVTSEPIYNYMADIWFQTTDIHGGWQSH